MGIRRLLRRYCLTWNTIRYRIEYRHIRLAFETLPRGGVLLDAGAGSGEMSARLHREGFCTRLIGVEPFEQNYRLLVENYASCRGSQTYQASIEDIPVADASVDHVLSTQVLEHIENHERAASEVVRVTKSGGHIVISVPHPPERMPNEEHVRPGYTEAELTRLFAPFGTERLLTDYLFTLPTQCRMIAAMELPLHGIYLPVGWADREKDLTLDQRRGAHPGVILCVFRKR